MTALNNPLTGKLALITGAANRIGAEIGRLLHSRGMDILLHYRSSRENAEQLQQELNSERGDSVRLIQADLLETEKIEQIVEQARAWRGRLDLLVNNASSFYPTPLPTASESEWDDLIGSNMKAPFFLSRAAAPLLRENRGSIINLVDIHAERPLPGHTIYCMAKAGNAMLVKSLAMELGPEIRVNGVAPGAILWPTEAPPESEKSEIIARTTLKRAGKPEDIALAVLFLTRDADYISGQIIAVDGGRSVQQ